MRLVFAFLATLAIGSAQNCTTWYDLVDHGSSQTFRNVKSFGAKGDGVTDDTSAIVTALTQGRSSAFSLQTPATVYFPPGNYLVSATLPIWFYTHVVGNAACKPTVTLKANSGASYVFSATVDPTGEHTNNFYHTLHHVDIAIEPQGNDDVYGIHWAVAQGTSIRDVSINATGAKGGLFCENGGGGFIGDLSITGGQVGLAIGGQQWTFRNVSVTQSTQACVQVLWNWAFAFLGLSVSDCPIGVDFQGSAVTSMSIVDSTMSNVGTGIATAYPTRSKAIVLDRVLTYRVPVIAPGLNGSPTGSQFVTAWRQSYTFTQSQPTPPFDGQGTFPPQRPNQALPNHARPSFLSSGTPLNVVADAGCKGDGVTDDSDCIQHALSSASFVFFPYGTYRITKTISVPPGARLVGDLMAILAVDGTSPVFSQPSDPQPMLLFLPGAPSFLCGFAISALSDAPGAWLIDWKASPGSAVFDTHFRLYFGVYGQWHFEPGSSAYVENSWGWTADHDIDTGDEITVKVPHGWLVQGDGVQLYGTAVEHNFLFNYNFSGASNVATLMMQTESPYWQSPPTSWGLTVEGGTTGMISHCSGFYSWFHGTQSVIARVQSPGVTLFNHNTIGSLSMLQYGSGGLIPNTTSASQDTFSAFFAANIDA
jgi:glucan 1,3-beta-glucosidase